jgi:hypothetical protein
MSNNENIKNSTDIGSSPLSRTILPLFHPRPASQSRECASKGHPSPFLRKFVR